MRRHVLIVDDDVETQVLTAPYLESHGMRVTTVTSPLEALEAIGDDPPDVVLLDVEAPHAQGFTLVDVLHDDRYELPVLVYTALDSSLMRHLAERLGVRDVLIKPLFPNELLRRIDTALEHLDPIPGLVPRR